MTKVAATLVGFALSCLSGCGDGGGNGGSGGAGAAGGAGGAGTSVTLATEQAGVNSIAVDGTSVYWTSSGDGVNQATVMKVGISGGTTQTLAGGLAGAEHIKVGGASLYFISMAIDGSGGVLMTVSVDGGTPKTLAAGSSSPLAGLAVDSTHVYWGVDNYPDGTIQRMALAGGSPEVVASGPLARAWYMTLDGTHVYWTGGDGVRRAPLTGGTPEVVASGVPQSHRISVDATHVYWSNRDVGRLHRVPLSGGAPEVVTPETFVMIRGGAVAVDETGVYFADEGCTDGGCAPSGKIYRVAQAGGDPITLASGALAPNDLAIDATHVYWTNGDEGTVMKVPK